jgi:hypothetical protein
LHSGEDDKFHKTVHLDLGKPEIIKKDQPKLALKDRGNRRPRAELKPIKYPPHKLERSSKKGFKVASKEHAWKMKTAGKKTGNRRLGWKRHSYNHDHYYYQPCESQCLKK